MSQTQSANLTERLGAVAKRSGRGKAELTKLRELIDGGVGMGLNVETAGQAPTTLAELEQRTSDLLKRCRDCEVRVLLFGPLKSGKSTLMNLLARNFRVSQVDPRPAFPCVVEVRNSTQGHGEKAQFFRTGEDEPYREMSVKEARLELDVLLNEYINSRCDGDFSQKLSRIVQQIDFSNGLREGVDAVLEDGFSLVFVDTPGLMFADEHYTEEAKKQQELADVAILVLRPEQLFFKDTREMVQKAAGSSPNSGASYQSLYVLVNASSQAKKLDQDGTVIDVNQVEQCDDIQKYFINHVTTNELAGLITKEEIALGFVDLLEACLALHGKKYPDFIAGPGAFLGRLEKDLRGKLATLKVHKAEGDWRNIDADATTYAKSVEATLKNELGKAAKEADDAREAAQKALGELEKRRKRSGDKEKELSAMAEWQEAITDTDALDRESGPVSPLWRGVKEQLRRSLDGKALDEHDVERHVERIVANWLETPGQTLAHLRDRVWTAKATEGRESLSGECAARCRDAVGSLSSEADHVLSGLPEDLGLIECLKAAMPCNPRVDEPKNPVKSPPPLIGVPELKEGLLNKFKSWLPKSLRSSPESFWGAEGETPVGRDGLKILRKAWGGDESTCRRLTKHVMGDPWLLWPGLRNTERLVDSAAKCFWGTFSEKAVVQIAKKIVQTEKALA